MKSFFNLTYPHPASRLEQIEISEADLLFRVWIFFFLNLIKKLSDHHGWVVHGRHGHKHLYITGKAMNGEHQIFYLK